MWHCSFRSSLPLSISLNGVTYEAIELVQGPPTIQWSYTLVTEAGILMDSDPSTRDKTKGLNKYT